MKELADFTVERLQRIIRNADGVTSPTYFEVSPADIAALARIALAAKTAEPVDISFIEGMEVSVDVSTCDADADHRYFGTVTEVSELDSAEKGYILLVKDAKPNSPELPDGWIPCAERMPEPETPVLIMLNGTIRKGAIFWEHPTFEEGGQPFKYWDDPDNDGQDWEVFDVTHWQPLPAPPTTEK